MRDKIVLDEQSGPIQTSVPGRILVVRSPFRRLQASLRRKYLLPPRFVSLPVPRCCFIQLAVSRFLFPYSRIFFSANIRCFVFISFHSFTPTIWFLLRPFHPANHSLHAKMSSEKGFHPTHQAPRPDTMPRSCGPPKHFIDMLTRVVVEAFIRPCTSVGTSGLWHLLFKCSRHSD